jgi:hypothetical protein
VKERKKEGTKGRKFQNKTKIETNEINKINYKEIKEAK